MPNRTVNVTKLMMPGEGVTYEAYLESLDVVEAVAQKNLGYKPDTGFRPATARERIDEWDSLSPEQRNVIIDKMGMQWYLSQAQEIERLREALADIKSAPPTNAPPTGSQ